MSRKDLKNAFSSPPEHFHNRVVMTLDKLEIQEKGEIKMKKMTFKSALIIAVMTILAISTTAIGVGKIGSIISQSGGIDYKTFPTAEKIEYDIGIKPQLISDFNNGFSFTRGHVSKNKVLDKDRNVVKSYSSVTLQYERSTDNLMVTMSDSSVNPTDDKYAVKSNYNGVELEYSSHISKFVPEDYQMTDQDKLDVESGKYVFNTGGGTITKEKVQAVTWENTNIRYTIIEMGESLSQQELLKMAQDILDVK